MTYINTCISNVNDVIKIFMVIVRFTVELTLGLELGQSKDIVVVLLVYNGQREIGDRHVT